MKKGNKPITFEERKEIQKLLSKGLSCSEISRYINRSKNGVVTEVRRGGGKDSYLAKKSQKEADLKNSIRCEKLKKINVGNKIQYYMKQRIENLEMQVEILYDTIKEIIKNDK